MKKILFVCGGNTCRSPMAKVILRQMLKERGSEEKFFVDSAAKGVPTQSTATEKARATIQQLYGTDLLIGHKPKSISDLNTQDFDLILTMEKRQKQGLPTGKTHTLREYAGLDGDVSDPYGQGPEVYEECRGEIEDCLQRILQKIVSARVWRVKKMPEKRSAVERWEERQRIVDEELQKLGWNIPEEKEKEREESSESETSEKPCMHA